MSKIFIVILLDYGLRNVLVNGFEFGEIFSFLCGWSERGSILFIVEGERRATDSTMI